MGRQIIDSQEEELGNVAPKKIGELNTHENIELDVDATFSNDDVKVEAFMNEEVDITVHGSNAEGDLPIISVIVNGMLQPIPRDQEITVKRKYVEALARAKTTTYRQEVNPVDPSDITMRPTTVLSYPFAVLKDTTAGKAWLKKVLAQA